MDNNIIEWNDFSVDITSSVLITRDFEMNIKIMHVNMWIQYQRYNAFFTSV